MRNLTVTLCLILAVLLGSAGVSAKASASEFFQSRFGQVSLNLPHPNNLCLLGQSQVEKILWKHQNLIQRKGGNKLLAMWINCNSQRAIKRGEDARLEEWVIVVGGLSGTPKSERIFPRLSADKFLNLISKKYRTLSLNKITKKVNRSIEKANSIYLGDKNALKVSEPINLGILAVEDSVHTGMIFNVKTKLENIPTLVVSSASLIKGVPISHYFYTTYKGKKSLTKLLPKAKYYTAKIIHAN